MSHLSLPQESQPLRLDAKRLVEWFIAKCEDMFTKAAQAGTEVPAFNYTFIELLKQIKDEQTELAVMQILVWHFNFNAAAVNIPAQALIEDLSRLPTSQHLLSMHFTECPPVIQPERRLILPN